MNHGVVRVLCVGAGHMGRSHALAYQKLDGFEICGVVTRTKESRDVLCGELGQQFPGFDDFQEALEATKPDAVSISSYPDTHFEFADAALRAGCHVFIEKPLAESVESAEALVRLATESGRKLVVGYILRHHPSWERFVEIAQGLGKPLVMRMNLNQQSSGANWKTHQALMASVTPLVDCGVHYIDVMCRMSNAKPIRVSGTSVRLTDALPPGRNNYGHLQVTFDDGSVGWYEAGWGPMMSETAFFVKDVIGPEGCVSIVAKSAGAAGSSADVNAHTRTQALLHHYGELDENGNFARDDEWIALDDEPDHDALCEREQAYFLRAIREDLDLTDELEAALVSMRVVAAAEESARSGKTIEL